MKAIGLAVVIVSGGCQGGRDPVEQGSGIGDAYRIAVRNQWTDEASWLRDGKVSKAEVEAAWDRYAECIRDGGGEVGPARFNPLDSVSYGGDTLPNGLSQEAFEALVEGCSLRMNIIVGSYAAIHPRRIDPNVAAELRRCLDAAGVEVTTDQELEDLINPSSEDGLPQVDERITSCLARYLAS